MQIRYLSGISLLIIASVMNSTLANDSMSDLNNGIIDDRSSSDFRSNTGAKWQLITDSVMGGLSSGQLTLENYQGRNCLRMRGEVTTGNNGGFIQLALSLSGLSQPEDDAFDASAYDGVELEVSGNNESYNIHFRTSDLWFPWQSYRFSFTARDDWQMLRIPFASLQPYKTSRAFSQNKIKRIGLVAIGRKFKADVCLAGIRLYSE
jgi:hypothetical protein